MPKYSDRTINCDNQKEKIRIAYSSENSVSETAAFGLLIGILDRAFVSEQQWSSNHGSIEQRSSSVVWLSTWCILYHSVFRT